MAYCILYHDYPKRMRLAKGGVVHAVKGSDENIVKTIEICKRGGTYDSREGTPFQMVQRACNTGHGFTRKSKWIRGERDSSGYLKGSYWLYEMAKSVELLPADTPITCKSCLAAMGDEDHVRKATHRYVIQDEDGFFLKKGAWSRGGRTLTPADAKLYKVKGAAEHINDYYVYIGPKGDLISREEWYKMGWRERREMGYRTEKRRGNKFKIRKVSIQLVEDDDEK